jgi:hypothetical protein
MVDSYRQIQEDKRNIKDQLGQLPDKTTTGKWNYYETLNIEEQASIVKYRSIAGNNGIYGHPTYGIYGQNHYGSPDGMIWGSTTFGIWGSAEWGPIQESFILGNSGAGILGTSKLGTSDIEWIYWSVTNPNNIFRERFRDTTFEDSDNTTADWDTVNYKIDFDSGEVVQSNVIAKNNVSYSQGKIIIQGTDTDNLTLYLSADGAGSWEEVTNNVVHNFSSSSVQGIHFKMVATGSATVTNIKIEYS